MLSTPYDKKHLYVLSETRKTSCYVTYAFINITMLKLNKSSTDGSNIALLIGESNSPSTFWVF